MSDTGASSFSGPEGPLLLHSRAGATTRADEGCDGTKHAKQMPKPEQTKDATELSIAKQMPKPEQTKDATRTKHCEANAKTGADEGCDGTKHCEANAKPSIRACDGTKPAEQNNLYLSSISIAPGKVYYSPE